VEPPACWLTTQGAGHSTCLNHCWLTILRCTACMALLLHPGTSPCQWMQLEEGWAHQVSGMRQG
jgi:hypothetical protein